MTAASSIRAAVALALVVACGRGLLTLIARSTPLYWFERWAIAFLLGTGALSFGWFALSPIYALVPCLWLLTALAIAVGCCTRRAAIVGSDPMTKNVIGSDPLFLVLAVALMLEVAVLFIAAQHTPLGWDALFNFEIKARLAFENVPSGRLPLDYFSDPSRIWTHPSYPLLVPFAEFWMYGWLGRVDQSAIKIVFPLFYVSLLAIVCGSVARVASLRMSLCAGLTLGLWPPLTIQPGAASGYADVPLAAAAAGAIAFTCLALRTGDRGALALAAVLSAVAAWTKAEGLILACALAFAALAVRAIDDRRSTIDDRRSTMAHLPLRRFAALVWLPLLAIGPWLVFQRIYGMANHGDFLPVSARVFIENVNRLPTIIVLVARELCRPGHWGLVWPVFFAGVGIMIWRGHATAAERFLAATVILPLALYAIAFVFSAWPDVREHMGWSLSRLMVPLAPMALLFIVTQLWQRDPAAARTWV